VKPTLEELEAAVRNQLCSICNKRTVEGICGDEQPERCSLFALFPLVAQAIMATEASNIQPYIDAIHENVCAVCIDQRLDGTCSQREEKRCALDSCMPQIVEAIEEAIGRKLGPDKTAGIPAR
jgi:hypothetical protein